MGFLAKLAVKEFFRTAGKGVLKVADKAVTGGVVHNIIEENNAPKGKLDVNKLIRTIVGSTIPILLLIALIKGWITIEQLKQLIKLL